MKYFSHFIIAFLFFVILTGCGLQQPHVEIYNRSKKNIDAVFIKSLHKAIPLHIAPGAFTAIEIPDDAFEPGADENTGVYIYQSGLKRGSFISKQSGIADFGNERCRLFVFDHGVRQTDKDFDPPMYFELFIVYNNDKKPELLTTLFEEGAQMRITDFTEGMALVKIPYDKFRRSPKILISISGKATVFTVEHDWEDWSYNQAVYAIETDGTVKKKESE